jgi:hypothetical protein
VKGAHGVHNPIDYPGPVIFVRGKVILIGKMLFSLFLFGQGHGGPSDLQHTGETGSWQVLNGAFQDKHTESQCPQGT